MGIGMSGRVPMSKTDQFWQYAKEKQGLLELLELELARAWTQAALQERASAVDHESPVEVGVS